eukprot:3368689-Pleurochrysis_carterae.AAC.1
MYKSRSTTYGMGAGVSVMGTCSGPAGFFCATDCHECLTPSRRFCCDTCDQPQPLLCLRDLGSNSKTEAGQICSGILAAAQSDQFMAMGSSPVAQRDVRANEELIDGLSHQVCKHCGHRQSSLSPPIPGAISDSPIL